MKTATAIPKAMVPLYERDNWLVFKYSDDDKVQPWRWPKAIAYDDRTYVWTSWNSDSMHINYKEHNKFAFPTKLK